MSIDESETVAFELGGRTVCRIASTNERKGRFTVERLCDVRCLLVSTISMEDDHSSLLQIACPNNCLREASTMKSCLTLSVNEDHYNVDITEVSVDNYCSMDQPHCVLCAVPTDEENSALECIQRIKEMIDVHLWTSPIMVLAYRVNSKLEPTPQVMRGLRDLARRPTAFKCLECSAVSKSLLRRCMALCLLAARPFLASVKAVEELKFDDEIINTKVKTRRRSSVADKIGDKKHAHKFCHIQ